MGDARQRAREAAFMALGGWLGGAPDDAVINAIEAYFDERMRGEAAESLGVEVLRERLTASQRYVADLEAVVRAADELRKLGELTAQEAYEAGPGTHNRWLRAPAKYDITRAKVEVPRE